MKTTTNMIGHQDPSRRRLWHFIALTLSMVMLCSVLLVAFHHHDDALDHDDDCPICAVVHHRAADIRITLPDVDYLAFSYPTCFAVFLLSFAVTRFCHSPQDRAPPA